MTSDAPKLPMPPKPRATPSTPLAAPAQHARCHARAVREGLGIIGAQRPRQVEAVGAIANVPTHKCSPENRR
jgi:hypothetical protein